MVHWKINLYRHFVTLSSLAGKVNIYDSLNLTPTQELLDQVEAVYSVNSSLPEIE